MEQVKECQFVLFSEAAQTFYDGVGGIANLDEAWKFDGVAGLIEACKIREMLREQQNEVYQVADIRDLVQNEEGRWGISFERSIREAWEQLNKEMVEQMKVEGEKKREELLREMVLDSASRIGWNMPWTV